MAKCRYNYTVQGSVRGEISRHRTLDRAIASRAKDHRDCASLGGGSYSDAEIYEVQHARSEATGRLCLERVDLDD